MIQHSPFVTAPGTWGCSTRKRSIHGGEVGVKGRFFTLKSPGSVVLCGLGTCADVLLPNPFRFIALHMESGPNCEALGMGSLGEMLVPRAKMVAE